MANYIVTVTDADDKPMAGFIAWADQITLTPETAEQLAQLILKKMLPTIDVYTLQFYGAVGLYAGIIHVEVVAPALGITLTNFAFVPQIETKLLQ